MEILFYLFLTLFGLYFIWYAIKINIIHPEKGEEMKKTYKNKNNINQTNDGKVKCPHCNSTQIQIVKRGWKVTTGFLGSGKNERVCMACKHRF